MEARPSGACHVERAQVAALCVLVVGIAAVLPGWYRQNWIWENPVQAMVGASLATVSTAVSLLIAVMARRHCITAKVADALACVLLALVVLGGFLFVRAGAAVILVPIEP